MILNLNPDTEQLIQDEIDLGRFTEPADVVRHAVELLHAEEPWWPEEKNALHERLTESMAQISRGQGIRGDQLFERLAAMREPR